MESKTEERTLAPRKTEEREEKKGFWEQIELWINCMKREKQKGKRWVGSNMMKEAVWVKYVLI